MSWPLLADGLPQLEAQPLADTRRLYTPGDVERVQCCTVSVVAGPDAGARVEIPLPGDAVMIGREASACLCITDPGVSRRHLALSPTPGGLVVTDLGTANGTHHGTQRIHSITVLESTRLRLGPQTQIEIVLGPAVEVTPYELGRFGHAIGGSPAMRELFGLLARVAPTDATVLLEGETGTGKEKLAEAIHQASRRARASFVVVDCGAIPRELVGSELFGHARGAFTGASAGRRGLVEEAMGGTLFLDELGELPLEVQPQLLRLLSKREARRIGETRAYAADIRVIAATHRDLRSMVRLGQFREDLYFRVAVVRATVPPLRARPEDLPALVEHFLEEIGRPDFRCARTLMARFLAYDWPGNLRELRNAVERAASLRGDWMEATTAPLGRPGEDPGSWDEPITGPFKIAKSLIVESFERDYLTQLLARHNGNLTSAAQEAGIDRNYVHRLLKKHNLPSGRD